jgi:S-adenosylmethionine-diacylglycerol 3-amino-3-carboxypropyl transferase
MSIAPAPAPEPTSETPSVNDNQTTLKDARRQRNELLKSAVHNHSAVTSRGIMERVFSYMFRGFVYPQIWEDPDVDTDAMALNQNHRVLTIASGGCNILNYLTHGPAQITAVDLNPAHIALTKLKLAALKNLDNYDQFFELFGEADTTANVKTYDTILRDRLDPVTRDYWDSKSWALGRRINYFTRNIYKFGLLGRFIGTVHRLAALYGRDPRVMLYARTREDQVRLFNEHLAPLFEKRFIKLLCSLPISLFSLGIPPAQFDALKGDANAGMAALLKSRLQRLCCDYDIKDNYFAWQAFGRGYDRAGRRAVPAYLKPENFASLKAQADKVQLHHLTLTDYLSTQGENAFDRYVFLDAQDWMNDDQLNDLWAQVVRTAKPGARVIFRTAGAESILPGRVHDNILNRFTYNAAQCKVWSDADRSSIYGGFHMYEMK